MAQPTSPTGTNVTAAPTVKNPAGIRPVYANNIGISGTLTDVQIIFTQVSQAAPDNAEMQPTNTVVSSILIPASLVQQLIDGLKTAIESHKHVVESVSKAQNASAK